MLYILSLHQLFTPKWYYKCSCNQSWPWLNASKLLQSELLGIGGDAIPAPGMWKSKKQKTWNCTTQQYLSKHYLVLRFLQSLLISSIFLVWWWIALLPNNRNSQHSLLISQEIHQGKLLDPELLLKIGPHLDVVRSNSDEHNLSKSIDRFHVTSSSSKILN